MSSKLRVQELRVELSKRGLDTAGLKPTLVARLDEAIASETQNDKVAAEVEEEPTEIDKNDEGKDKKKTHPRDDDTHASVKRMKVEEVNKLSIDELKKALKSLDCSTVGSKASLKKRLLSALPASLQDSALPDADKREDSVEKLVTATKKGRAVLDPNLPEHIKSNHHVLEEGDEIYDAMLNQTNVGGNNNKYYVIQALENDTGTSYQLFTRWGRVGAKGQSNLAYCADKDQVRDLFYDIFHRKTNNFWPSRHTFTSYPGKYTWLEMDYDAVETPEEVDNGTKVITKEPLPSKLNPLVQKLISLICNINMMKQQMSEIGYDARKLPLGKLSKSTILKGYDVLKRIAASLEGRTNLSELQQLSSEFYTVIPHDFGFKNTLSFTIDTPQLLKTKLEMVEALGEIELASKILRGKESETPEDPLLSHYEMLKCEIEPLPMDSDEADWIKSYTQNSHGASHGGYSLAVEQIFKVARNGEETCFQPFAGVKNRMLLWHGSRLCNWTGILSQGLRIAPPEAPVSGYMFGKGVYFADMVSKSANYCYPNHSDPVGLLLLCEVALGDMHELRQSDYNADQLPQGKLSTKGVGSTAPDSNECKFLSDGVVVPMGKPKTRDVKSASLLYNEYIVYNTAQIRMKYLLMVRFHYKSHR